MKLGSLFAGIGGFELGLERAIPGLETIWQVEQDKFCQKVLAKHWPHAKIYDDVRNITKNNVEPVDMLCGGFPCQDISVAGKGEGINGAKSGLWREMFRIIGEIRPRIILLENVSSIVQNGGRVVIEDLTSLGYDTEWTIISAQQFGAPHLRKRWFCVAYPLGLSAQVQTQGRFPVKQEFGGPCKNRKTLSYWEERPAPHRVCGMDDGIPNRVARLRALGNAIVPQCSQWIGEQILKSGLLEEL